MTGGARHDAASLVCEALNLEIALAVVVTHDLNPRIRQDQLFPLMGTTHLRSYALICTMHWDRLLHSLVHCDDAVRLNVDPARYIGSPYQSCGLKLPEEEGTVFFELGLAPDLVLASGNPVWGFVSGLALYATLSLGLAGDSAPPIQVAPEYFFSAPEIQLALPMFQALCPHVCVLWVLSPRGLFLESPEPS